jgi:hypothetical protein
MLEEFAHYRGYCAWLADYTSCPCNTRDPFATVCQYVIPVSRIPPRCQRRPRVGGVPGVPHWANPPIQTGTVLVELNLNSRSEKHAAMTRPANDAACAVAAVEVHHDRDRLETTIHASRPTPC